MSSSLLATAAAFGLRRIASRRRWAPTTPTMMMLLFSSTSSSSSSSSSTKPPPPLPPTAVTLEVRAGTGGLDASLFAAELFRAYRRHAASAGWEWRELRRLSSAGGGGGTGSSSSNSSPSSSAEGIKLAAARVKGPGVAESLRNEAGVHRVQRVPVTESGGRQHTSAATVAVLLEDDNNNTASSLLLLNPEDVRIDTMRSSGKGGQHANATDSAVRAVHLPSGMAVAVRSGRSQHRNKAAAVAELSRRIRGKSEEGKAREVSSERRGQLGGGDRSEKVRTYNFNRGVVLDHRSWVKIGDVSAVMSGERLGELFVVD